MAIALCIQGVQEFEGNYSVGVTNFQIEQELQNEAESALIEALQTNAASLTKKISAKYSGKITVKVYSQDEAIYDKKDKYVKEIDLPAQKKSGLPVKAFISVASCNNKYVGGKNYYRALAYVLDGEIYFMNEFSFSEPIYDRQE